MPNQTVKAIQKLQKERDQALKDFDFADTRLLQTLGAMEISQKAKKKSIKRLSFDDVKNNTSLLENKDNTREKFDQVEKEYIDVLFNEKNQWATNYWYYFHPLNKGHYPSKSAINNLNKKLEEKGESFYRIMYEWMNTSWYICWYRMCLDHLRTHGYCGCYFCEFNKQNNSRVYRLMGYCK